jgi:hypothetical protein
MRADLNGKTFDKLVVVAFVGVSARSAQWLCQCVCGEKRIVTTRLLNAGYAKSCKTCSTAASAKTYLPKTHGQTGSPTYRSWSSMIKRCRYPSWRNFQYWGGRGVSVCVRWQKFENFLTDMGERPAGKSIDRYPNKDGNYEPGNCRWATPKEQAANRRAWGTA